MITLKEIKGYLEKSVNPLFFFDDDSDGLCSFLLLYKYFKKGNWVPLKSSPALEEIYIRKVQEYNPDLIIVLDKPILNHEFVEKCNVPIIWIDHHPPHTVKGVKHFNPLLKDKNDSRPTSYWCYKIVNQDLLLANIGIIGDWSLAMVKEFRKKYPDLIKIETKNPGKVLFETKMGELIRIYNFLLKGRISSVRKRISTMIKIKDPNEILKQETARGKYLYKKYEKINKVYLNLLKKAMETKPRNKLLVFTYTLQKFSFTGELANELIHRNPDKIILVAREKSGEMKLSGRSNSVGKIAIRTLAEKAIEGVEGYCGGHEHAIGGNIQKQDFTKFVENLERLIK